MLHVSQLDELSLWHYQLGHTSMTEHMLHDLDKFFKSLSSSKISCEISRLPNNTSCHSLNMNPMQLNLLNLYPLTFGALTPFMHTMV